MSISNTSVLRVVSKKTKVVIKAPSSDTNRRMKVFFDARQNAIFQIVEQSPDAKNTFSQGFHHLAVIAGPAGFNLYTGESYGLPDGLQFLKEPVQNNLINLPIRHHRVRLSDDVDLQITSAWLLPGDLMVPVTFTAGTR